MLLKWEEVYRIWETARDAAAPEKILIAGTGAESTAETIEHTNRAASLGYALALVRTPSFYKPAMTESALAEHYLRVADAARIPILVYSVPVFTHVTVEAPLVARVSKHPNIIGMKDSSGSVPGSCRNYRCSAERVSDAGRFSIHAVRIAGERRGRSDPRRSLRVSGIVRGDLRSVARR